MYILCQIQHFTLGLAEGTHPLFYICHIADLSVSYLFVLYVFQALRSAWTTRRARARWRCSRRRGWTRASRTSAAPASRASRPPSRCRPRAPAAAATATPTRCTHSGPFAVSNFVNYFIRSRSLSSKGGKGPFTT